MAPDDVATTRAVYDATAELYVQSVGTEVDPAFEGPVDRAFLTAFVELAAPNGGPIADLGCGPGRVAAFLAAHHLDVVGMDVSPAMVAIARQVHPTISFAAGSLHALPFADGSLAGAACWYSLIHTAPDDLEPVFAELGRALCDGAELLLAFQSGDGECVRRPDAHGTGLPLVSHRHSPPQVVEALGEAGLHVHARGEREPALEHETTPQTFILARAVGRL